MWVWIPLIAFTGIILLLVSHTSCVSIATSKIFENRVEESIAWSTTPQCCILFFIQRKLYRFSLYINIIWYLVQSTKIILVVLGHIIHILTNILLWSYHPLPCNIVHPHWSKIVPHIDFMVLQQSRLQM